MGKAVEHSFFTIPRGYLHGLTLSTAGSSATYGIALGEAADDTFTSVMTLGSAYTKTTSAWAVGTGNGSLDTGTIAANAWYHVYLIKRPDTGVVDVLCSLSATAPTMPTNYTLKRRIGSLRTNGSSVWSLFWQNGDEFLWDTPVADVQATNPGTTAVTRTLTVPTGLKINAIFSVIAQGSSSLDTRGVVSPLDIPTPTLNSATYNFGGYNSAGNTHAVIGQYNMRTNTSAQIRTQIGASDAATFFGVVTSGWWDTRGKLS